MSTWEKATKIDGNDNGIFDSTVEALAKEHKNLFVFLTGEKKEDGSSWCPDCNVVAPTLEAELNKRDDIHLLIVTCKREQYMGNQEVRKRLGSCCYRCNDCSPFLFL